MMMMAFVAYAVIVVVLIIVVWLYQLWRLRRIRRMIADLPGPPVLPFIGNSLEFAGNNADIMHTILDLPKRYPSPFRIWIGSSATIVVTSPSDIQILLCNPKALVRNKGYNFLKPFVGNGLLIAPMPVWKKHRKVIMQTFNQKVLDTFVEIFVKNCNVLIHQLKKQVGKGTFDAFLYTSPYAVDSICETTMGVKLKAQTQRSPFLLWLNTGFDIAIRRIVQTWLAIDFIFKLTKYAKQEKEIARNIQRFVDDVIKEKKRENNEKKEESSADIFLNKVSKCGSTLDQMIELSNNGDIFTDEDIRNEVNTIIAAGSDTTASTIGFILIMLAMHPEHQGELYEEVMDVLGPDRTLSHMDLKRLVFTERVIKETLRIFPAGPVVSRIAENDIHLETCIVPATSAFVVHIIGMHRDPNVYPDPLKFDPDRFLPEEIAKRHPYSWIPFAGGPRNCIGINYAMMQMKAVTACLVRKYKFKTEYKSVESVQLSCSLIIKPTFGYSVSIESRE